jgi:hypothetical protein
MAIPVSGAARSRRSHSRHALGERATDVFASRRKPSVVLHDSPRFFIASTPVIRQLAKEIRIHNSNRFSFLLAPPTPPSSDDTRVSKLLSLRVHKVDWTVARELLLRSPLVYVLLMYVSQLTWKFARMRAESTTVRVFVSRKINESSIIGFDSCLV